MGALVTFQPAALVEDEPEPPVDLAGRRAEREARAAWGPVLKALRVDVMSFTPSPSFVAAYGTSASRYQRPLDRGFVDFAADLAPPARDAAIARELANVIRLRAEARAHQAAGKAPRRRRLAADTSRVDEARARGVYAVPSAGAR